MSGIFPICHIDLRHTAAQRRDFNAIRYRNTVSKKRVVWPNLAGLNQYPLSVSYCNACVMPSFRHSRKFATPTFWGLKYGPISCDMAPFMMKKAISPLGIFCLF